MTKDERAERDIRRAVAAAHEAYGKWTRSSPLQKKLSDAQEELARANKAIAEAHVAYTRHVVKY